jgi:NAD(P)-dependent dehydrogenase (short-subunit alcohol dehydrogenase family)
LIESDEAVKQQFDINVFGVLRLTRSFLPSFRAQKSGVIANLSSVGGFHSGAGSGLYCSTKFALEALTSSLGQELAPFGVSAIAIEPGYTRTEFLKNPSAGANIATQLDAYKGTPADDTRQALFAYNGKQPGDPKRSADRMWEAISGKGYFEGKKIPTNLFLGSDCQKIVRDCLKEVIEVLDEQVEVSKSTDIVE